MAGIPPFLLAQAGQDITVEPYEGTNATGPVYGPPVVVRAVVEHTRRTVRDDTGAEVTADTTARVQLGPTIPPESRVTLPGGRATTVITTHTHDGGRLPVPSHLEVALR